MGFIGTTFRNYFIKMQATEKSSEISQNCLNMFGYDDPISFVVRLAIFFLLFATYPLLNLFARTLLLNIFFSNEPVDKRDLVVMNLLVTIIPLSFACLYPYVGTLLAFSGAFAGFVSMYLLPVLVHLKRKYTMLTNPLLAEAIALNEFTIMNSVSARQCGSSISSMDLSKSPKIVISDRLAVGLENKSLESPSGVEPDSAELKRA